MATPAPSPSASQPSREEVAAQMAASLGAQQSTGKPGTAFDRWNYGPAARDRGGEYQGQRLAGGAVTRSVQDMINDYYKWSDAQKGQLRAKLAMIDKDALRATDDQVASMWGAYVQQSANYFSAGQAISPWDILAKDIGVRGGSASLAGTRTQTSTDVSLTSRIDSDAIFQSAAQSLLGRDPTPSEAAAFNSILNSKERANPTTSTTTTTTDAEGNVTNQSRTSQGGLGAGGAQLLAKGQAEQNPEYGAHQAATTYYNAMMQTIMRGY